MQIKNSFKKFLVPVLIIFSLFIFSYVYAVSSGGGSVTVSIPTGFNKNASVSITVQGTDSAGATITSEPFVVEIVPAGGIAITSFTADPAGPLSASSTNPASTTLSWTTSGTPDSCVASGNFWSGSKNSSSGNEVISNLVPTSTTTSKTYIFGLVCKKAGLPDATATVTVVVNPASALSCTPSVQSGTTSDNYSFAATGGTGTYSWNATGSGVPSGSGQSFNTFYSSSGSKTVTLSSGTMSASCAVTVSAPGVCTNGATQTCSVANSCSMTSSGSQTCVSGNWSSCSATPPSDNLCSTSNSCGSASGGAPASTPPTTNLCTTGSASSVNLNTVNSTYVWGCGTQSCSTPYNGPINGVCGAAAGNTSGDPSGAPLCYTGSSSGLQPNGDGSYSWTCNGLNGGVETSCANSAPNSSCDFNYANSSGSTLSWSTNTNCDNISLVGPNGYMPNIYTDPDTGNVTNISWPQIKSMSVAPGTYRINASGAPYRGHTGSVSRFVDVTGIDANLSANPTSIYTGGSTTLTWSSTLATSCTGTNFNTGGAISGSVVVKPTSTVTYSINCGGTVTSLTVTVKHKPGFIEN